MGESLYSPLSLTVVVPGLYLTSFGAAYFKIAFIIIPLVFIAWTWRLYIHDGKIPLRSSVTFLITSLLSGFYLITRWEYGLEYQGIDHTIAMYGYNLLFWLALIFAYVWNRKKPTFFSSFLFHLIFFSWLSWVAFPWLGELI